MVLRTLGRIFVVGFAVLLAVAVALTVLVTVGLEQFTRVFHGRDPMAGDLDGALVVAWSGWRILSAATIVPGLLLVAIGEIARIRAPLFYILGGGAALAAIPLLARLGETGADALPTLIVWEMFATAGFAAGGVYWLIAGRGA